MTRRTVLAVACVCSILASAHLRAAGAQVFFVVRHAERADSGTPSGRSMNVDPPLSTAGQERARRLASLLRSANVTHIFTTEFQRTRQTAAPLAAQVHQEPVTVAADDVNGLMERLLKTSGATLVVAHSNTVPDIMKRLGVAEQVSIPDSEFDNLFVIVRQPDGAATLVRLKY
jgi:broad specificity phosphatase PhoE